MAWQIRLSVVCDVRAPYSRSLPFRGYFYLAIRQLIHQKSRRSSKEIIPSERIKQEGGGHVWLSHLVMSFLYCYLYVFTAHCSVCTVYFCHCSHVNVTRLWHSIEMQTHVRRPLDRLQCIFALCDLDLWSFDLILIGGRGLVMNYPCGKFGDCSYSSFGFIVRTDKNTQTPINTLLPRLPSAWVIILWQ